MQILVNMPPYFLGWQDYIEYEGESGEHSFVLPAVIDDEGDSFAIIVDL